MTRWPMIELISGSWNVRVMRQLRNESHCNNHMWLISWKVYNFIGNQFAVALSRFISSFSSSVTDDLSAPVDHCAARSDWQCNMHIWQVAPSVTQSVIQPKSNSTTAPVRRRQSLWRRHRNRPARCALTVTDDEMRGESASQQCAAAAAATAAAAARQRCWTACRININMASPVVLRRRCLSTLTVRAECRTTVWYDVTDTPAWRHDVISYEMERYVLRCRWA